MVRFILSKLLYLVPTFLGITVIAFSFVRILPGDPVLLMAGERGVSPERHAELTAQLGYDKPVVMQYFDFLGRLLQEAGADRIPDPVPGNGRTGPLRHHHRHADRCAGGRAGRHQAGKLVRPDFHDRRAGGLFHADLLVGPAADHPVFGHPGLDPGVGPHQPAPDVGAERRVHLGAEPPDPALCRAGDDPAGGDRAADPFGHAGGDGRGLCPHRPRQGDAPLPRDRRACPAQCHDPGDHHHRPANRCADGRRHPDRDDLFLARHRQMDDRFHLAP
ncbi:UNVERIFIED_CONTAM: dppB [Trichonephila clavipes]